MKEEALEKLDALNIEYKEITHDAVYTIEEMDALGKDYFEGAKICKNLFVRDQKGKRHFLVVLPEEKRAPLDVIATKIGSTRLSFASNERLMKYLKLTPGAVTPLSVINDEENAVEVILDEEKVIVYGHTHIIEKYQKNGRTYINLGSITLPKQNTKR